MKILDKIFFLPIISHENKPFENLWEINNGVTFNSYLIKDDKTILIDASLKDDFLKLKENIEKYVDLKEISYLIIHHFEPDHSQSVVEFYNLLPNLEIFTSKAGVQMLSSFYGIKDRVREIKDGEKIELKNFSLRFLLTPFIHWPETFMTFEEKNGILFSNDCFGGFGAIRDKIFLEEEDDEILKKERFRYFITVLSSYTSFIEKALTKIENLNPSFICPSHGLLIKNGKEAIEEYKNWCKLKNSEKNYIPIITSTMYGFSQNASSFIKNKLTERGLKTNIFNINELPQSSILEEIYVAKNLILIAPTYEGGIFPKMAELLIMAKAKKMENKRVLYLGSYAWSGGAKKDLQEWCKMLNWDFIEGLEFKGNYEFYKEKIEETLNTFLSQ